MLSYWILFMLFAAFVALDYVKLYLPTYQKQLILAGLLMVMVLFAGLRYQSDNDYETYVHVYENSPTIWQLLQGQATLDDVYGEYLFGLINILIRSLAMPSAVMFSLVAFFTFYYLYKTIHELTLSPFAVLFLYVCMYFLAGGFTQIRFGLATTMSWYGLACLFKGKRYLAALYVFIACFFHIGAIAAFAVFTIRYIRLNTWTVYGAILFAGFIATLNLTPVILGLLSRLLPSGRYDNYLVLEAYVTKANQTGIYLNCILAVAFWETRKFYKGFNEWLFPFLMKTALLSLVFGAFFIQMAIISRFGVLLQLVFIFIIPMLCGLQRLRYFLYAPLIVYGMFRYSQFLNEESGFIQEYKNVITK